MLAKGHCLGRDRVGTNKPRKLKLKKESLKRLGDRQLAVAKGGTDSTADDCTFGLDCITFTLGDSFDGLCLP
jgi:hypothetical protein